MRNRHSRSSAPFPRRTAVHVAVLALLACSGQACADDDAATTLARVQVNAYRPAQTAGSATKTDTPLAETAQSVSVIAAEELDARGVQNLNEATRYNAGVLPESSGMDNRVDDLYIRGFDAGSWGNNVMLDGLRAPSNGSDSWNRVSFNTWNLERVEVLKGPSSVLYGQLAPGGMVNQISKTPTPDQEQVLRLQVDANGRAQSAFDIGGASAGQGLPWRLVGLYADGPTQLEHTDHRQWFLAPSATLRFNDDATRLTLLGIYQRDDGGSTFQFLPYQGSAIRAASGYIGNTTFLGEPDWNLYDRTVWAAGWLFEHRFNAHWKLSQSARYTHADSLYRATVVYGVRGASVSNPNVLSNGHLLPRRAVQGVGDSDGKAIDTRLEGRFSTGALEHTLLLGFDWQQSEWSFLRKMANVNPNAIAIDIYDPVYTHYDFASVLTITQANTREVDRQGGVYLQDQIALGRWRFSAGGRYDRATVDAHNLLTGVHSKADDGAFSGRAGALYLVDNGLSPYVSYAESFQPATGTRRDGASFDPITGKQWEVGVKYAPRSIDGMITLSAYDLRQQNMLTADPLNTGAESYQVQTGEVRVRGAELEGRITPLPGFSVIGALTRLASEVTRNNDGYVGNRMIRVPPWMASLWLDYTFQAGALQGLSVAAGARYVDDTYGDLANTLYVPSYTLFDAAIRYDLGRFGGTGVRLALNGSNLADKRYVATCSALTACYYGTGRTVTATARFSW
ncbi:TonB-dependent siderophore receptor [Xanthomonas campestris pv. phormiicola]|nr:TonB-dependent siderophore receptor [Xanthomonas campestris pv. phormiicola]